MKKYDVILVTPDTYIDHPSFANSLITRNLEKAGFSVAVIDRPRWQENDYFKYGTPRLFWAVSGGNVDSVVLNYTPFMKKRKTDAYQENGNPYFTDMPRGEKSRIRPDRCITVYVNGIKTKDKKTPVIIGGIEASMRRFAHYDFLSDRVRASVLVDCGADLLVYGMGEKTIIQVANEIVSGNNVKELNIRGTVRLLDKNENIDAINLPDFDKVRNHKNAFVEMTEMIYRNANPYTAKALIQKHSGRRVVQFPPAYPLSQKELDKIYNHNFDYGKNKDNVPALRMIKNSVTSHRGCFGGCSFCALTLHQGKTVQSRSINNVLTEIKKRARQKGFSGVITDIGGPSADMYGYICKNKYCERLSCLYPEICAKIENQESGALKLYRKALSLKDENDKPLLKHVFIGSGIRHDLLVKQPEFFKFLVENLVSGYLKCAPEHVSFNVLDLMKKPGVNIFQNFFNEFKKLTKKAGKKQFVIPYLIIGHPGETMQDVYELRDFLKKNKLKVEQVQVFTPTPMTLSTCMYYTGIVPFMREQIFVCRDKKELAKKRNCC